MSKITDFIAGCLDIAMAIVEGKKNSDAGRAKLSQLVAILAGSEKLEAYKVDLKSFEVFENASEKGKNVFRSMLSQARGAVKHASEKGKNDWITAWSKGEYPDIPANNEEGLISLTPSKYRSLFMVKTDGITMAMNKLLRELPLENEEERIERWTKFVASMEIQLSGSQLEGVEQRLESADLI